MLRFYFFFHSFLICNSKYLICPNQVRSCPFSSPLISFRSDKDWLSHVRTGYYLYPIHPSGSFMVMGSFAGALYMVLLRLLRRDYEGLISFLLFLLFYHSYFFHFTEASTLLSTCSSDGPFTKEEQWIISQFKATETDAHPNAHALRLRIAVLCLEHSPELIQWDQVEEDLFDYLQKYPHVAALCRLTGEEERLLLEFLVQMQDGRLIQFPTTLRLRYLQALSDAKETEESKTLALPRQTRYGGARLRALYVHSFRYCKSTFEKRTGHLYYNYRRPGNSDTVPVTGVAAFKLMQKLIDDNMYGQTHHTGFFLLYEMMLGRTHVRICPENEPIELKQREIGFSPNEKEDRGHLKRVMAIEKNEGPRYRSTCLVLAKLMLYTLYFRYETPRGLPPDTGCSFAFLPLILSSLESDPTYKEHSWRFPSLPYSKYLPLMSSSHTGPARAQQAGFWGDRSPNGIAIDFERLMTRAAVVYSHGSSWGRNGAFQYAKLKFPNYYCELGDPALIVISPQMSLNCRPEVTRFDCEEVYFILLLFFWNLVEKKILFLIFLLFLIFSLFLDQT